MRQSSGTTSESSAKSSQVSWMPAARAIATRWSVWLVEPPVACRPTMPLTIARSSITSPTGVYSLPSAVISATRRAAACGQRVAQRRVRVDEGGARQVQAHDLHQHLVGVGGAVEGAGAGAVVGLRSRPRAARRGRPCPRRRAGGPCAFSSFGRPEVIGPAGHEDRRQVAEARAPPSAGPARSCRRCRGTSAASNMSCESATAAASAITSRENSDSSMPGWPCVTPSHIAGTPPANCATPPASRAACLISAGIALERLMRREHVVVGGDDGEVGLDVALERRPCRRAPQAAKPCARLLQESAVRCGPRRAACADLLEIGARLAALRAAMRAVTSTTGDAWHPPSSG